MQESAHGRRFAIGDQVIFDSTGMEAASPREWFDGRDLTAAQRSALAGLRDSRGRVRCHITAVLDDPSKPPAYRVTAADGTALLVEGWRILGLADSPPA